MHLKKIIMIKLFLIDTKINIFCFQLKKKIGFTTVQCVKSPTKVVMEKFAQFAVLQWLINVKSVKTCIQNIYHVTCTSEENVTLKIFSIAMIVLIRHILKVVCVIIFK